MPFEMIVPTAFKAQIYFHVLLFISKEPDGMKPSINLNAMISTLEGTTAEPVQKAWDAFME